MKVRICERVDLVRTQTEAIHNLPSNLKKTTNLDKTEKEMPNEILCVFLFYFLYCAIITTFLLSLSYSQIFPYSPS